MDIQKRETARGRILRLVDVLKMTGLSRSTLYSRIANREFPHQVSLGGRAVGWIEAEVEYWLNERWLLRPPETVTSEHMRAAPRAEYSVPLGVHQVKREARRPAEPTSCTISADDGSPDLVQLHLVSANLYFDRSSQVFWLKLIPEKKPAR